MDEQEKREQEREDFRRTGGRVTRIEFYVSFLLLAALVLLRVGLNSQKLELRMTLLENSVTHKIDALWDDVNREIEAIPGKVMRENESMFSDRNLFITEVDRKAQTFLLKLTGTPKEYCEGMEVTFLVSCDSEEPVSVPARFGEDRMLRAEAELPFCENASVSAVLKTDGMEKAQSFGEINAQMDYGLVPEFSGGWKTYGLMPKKDWVLHDGQISVDVSAKEAKGLSFGEGSMEIQVDGKTVQTMQAEKEFLGTREWSFHAEQEEDIELKEGQVLSLIFKITDDEGVKYTYLVKQFDVTKDGLEEKRPENWDENPLKDGRLTME